MYIMKSHYQEKSTTPSWKYLDIFWPQKKETIKKLKKLKKTKNKKKISW